MRDLAARCPHLSSMLALAALLASACSDPAPAATHALVPTTAEPVALCGSALERAAVQAIGPRPPLCGADLVHTRYLRAGIGGHDVVLVLTTDARSTASDGPTREERWLLIDGALAECAAPPCVALDALGAGAADPDDDVTALLAIASSFAPGDLALRGEDVEARAALWVAHAETLRARPVGIVREGANATLRSWRARTVAGMDGDYRTLDYVTASLAHGEIRIDAERVVEERGAHIKTWGGR